jgi:hypothetical protein
MYEHSAMGSQLKHLQPSFVAEFANAILPKPASEPAAPVAHALT